MLTFPPYNLNPVARRGPPWAIALTTAVLTLPLLIVTTALIPALMICPFLSNRHQCFVLRLLADLRQWGTAIKNGGQYDTASGDADAGALGFRR